MRHLITGGAGFIGSHLAELLVARGDYVVALDDLSTGSRANVAHLPADRFDLVHGSILDSSVVEQIVHEADDVYHLAAAVGVQRIRERPVDSLVTNAVGTQHVLRACARFGRPVLLTSSSEVYAASEAVPFSEDAPVTLGPTVQPRWGYACSKAFDEFLALAYVAERGLRATIVRLFNTVGPRQSDQYGMVVPRFVRQALAGQPLTVYGDGAQTRCFVWVGDVVQALPRLLELPAGQVCNLGSTEEVTIRALAERVIVRTGSVSSIVSVPFDEALPGFQDMRRRVPSIDRARMLIGFAPTLSLDGILERVIGYERAGRAQQRSLPLNTGD